MENSEGSSSLHGSTDNERSNGSIDEDCFIDEDFASKDYAEGCTLEADHGSLPLKCNLCDKPFSDPVVLSCLHVFDLTCLRDKKTASQKNDDINVDGHDGMAVLDDDGKVSFDAILNGNSMFSPTVCPICKSSSGHLDSLPSYHMFSGNQMRKKGLQDEIDGSGDAEAVEAPVHLQCTMCTKGVEAMAKCMDCAEFMCSGCIGAHQSMRIFAGHKSTKLTDEDKKDMASLSKNISKNKPIKCRTHPTEQCKLFCIQCCVLICSDCMTLDHKQHVCERVTDVGARLKNEILQISEDAQKSVQTLKSASESLSTLLHDVALARDNNRSSIEETFQSYKAILNEIKEQTLKRNKELHDSIEMDILDRITQIDKTCEQYEYAETFLRNYVDNGSSTHLASVMKPLRERLLYLSRMRVETNIETSVPFHTDRERFKNSVEFEFGWLGNSPVPPSVDVNNGTVDSLAAAVRLWPLNPNSTGAMGDDMLTNGTSFPNVNSSDPSSDLIAGIPFNNLPNTSDLASVGPLASEFSLPPLPGPRAITSHIADSTESVSPNLNGGSPSSLNAVSLPPVPSPTELLLGGNVPITAACSISMSTSNLTSSGTSGSVAGISRGLNALNFNPSNNDMIVSPSCPLGGISNTNAPTTASAPETPRGPTPANGLDTISSVGDSTLITQSAVGIGGSIMSSSCVVSGPSGGSCLPPSVINQPLAKPGGSSGYNPNPNPPFPNRGNRCSQMNVRFRWGQLGSARGQFNSPHGFCLGFEEEIVVADTQNHRIQIFDKEGTQRGCFGVAGREEGQLWYPRKVAIMRQSQKYVICDRGNERSRMQIFTRSGHFVKKIAIRYIDIVAGLAINSYGHIVAVDSVSPTVFVISEAGDLIKWFDCSDYMREPSDIAVSGREYFICDFKGHCVAVFQEDGTFMRRIGSETITNFPNGIDISDAGDVLIGDSHGNRFHVAVYSRVGELMSEFECLQFKVSRCCGLKITSEGYIVTLAKNNHHVLVLNTLYIA